MRGGVARWLPALVVLLSIWPESARAYTVQSGFTKSCHERISLPALQFYLFSMAAVHDIALPGDDVWRGATDDVAEATFDAEGELKRLLEDERLEFAAVSLLVGLREPDTNGYSVSDLDAIRSAHGDESPAAQYAHALRASSDEGRDGDLQALAGAREAIRQDLSEMARLLGERGSDQVIERPLYVEHYGRIDVPVWGPAYHLGLALHVLQDSFSHTIRTEDGVHVLHVLNYVDAFRGPVDEPIDGLAHSTAMDQCDRTENEEHVLQASDRSVALVAAAVKLAQGDGGQAVEVALSDCETPLLGELECGMLAYFPECQGRVLAGEELSGTCCSPETSFCDAALLPTIRATPTRPYLQSAIGCRLAPAAAKGPVWPLFFALFAFLLAVARRRDRRSFLRARPHLLRIVSQSVSSSVALSVILYGRPAEAGEQPVPATFVLGAQSHGALLTDAEERSILDMSYGWSLRAGYRTRETNFGQFGAFLFAQRDTWVATDYELRADPGVANFGAGLELLYFDSFRTAFVFGPSQLVFDTALHDAGSLGVYTELYPIGVRSSLGRWWGLLFDPLSVAWVNPTPEFGKAPSLGHLQYRTTLSLEWSSVPR